MKVLLGQKTFVHYLVRSTLTLGVFFLEILSFLNVLYICHLFYYFHVFIELCLTHEGNMNKQIIIKLVSVTHYKIWGEIPFKREEWWNMPQRHSTKHKEDKEPEGESRVFQKIGHISACLDFQSTAQTQT